jgi:galactose mutarotase-like enzyme
MSESTTFAESDLKSFILTFGKQGSDENVCVEVSSLGASIQRILVPRLEDDNSVKAHDDIVLGYDSASSMHSTGNPAYFGAIVGRVANRIAQGRFTTSTGESIQGLAINNPPNHLHGGQVGFSRRIWQVVHAKPNSVQFSLVSPDGDEGYPAGIRVTAEYTLHPGRFAAVLNEEHSTTSYFHLHSKMTGALLEGEARSSPINLAQHTYFSLGGHDDPDGILDHELQLDCEWYTPMNSASIPTRQVVNVTDNSVMDWRQPNRRVTARMPSSTNVTVGSSLGGRLIRSALHDFGRDVLGYDSALLNDLLANRGKSALGAVGPFGFDHNYVVNRRPAVYHPLATSVNDADKAGNNEGFVDSEHADHCPADLCRVGMLSHPPTGRALTVYTDAPGVQLYTANFVDRNTVPPRHRKDGAEYDRWQGICLETQHYPDSILSEEEISLYPEFAEGRCPILMPGDSTYEHNVVYEISFPKAKKRARSIHAMTSSFQGRTSGDSEQRFGSPLEMWVSQQVIDQKTGVQIQSAPSWYERAAEYYERNCSTDLEGVLGGFATISDIDLEGSRIFTDELARTRPSSFSWSDGAALECGAGIGRVTKGLLLDLDVWRCDLVESNSRLLSEAPDFIGNGAERCRFFCAALQDWNSPRDGTRYSIIWIQWVFCYLTDDDAVDFLRRCAASLVDGGMIVLKENTCSGSDDYVVDIDDASLTRSVPYLMVIAKESGLKLVLQKQQTNFPDDIFPVYMLAFEKEVPVR